MSDPTAVIAPAQMQAASSTPFQDMVEDDDMNSDEKQASVVLDRVRCTVGPLTLVKDRQAQQADVESQKRSSSWKPFLEDGPRRSFSYVLRHEADNSAGIIDGVKDDPNNLPSPTSTSSSNSSLPRPRFSSFELARWFRELHPDALGVNTTGAWTDAHYKGKLLLRKTAWHVLNPECECEYGYSDTWQMRITNERMRDLLSEMSQRVFEVCGLDGDDLNSVNLNYYPRGGGVGFHADDEFLFDGLNRDACIVSLSLCGASGSEEEEEDKGAGAGGTAPLDDEGGGKNGGGNNPENKTPTTGSEEEQGGSRKFQVRLKKAFAGRDPKIHEVVLNHGDLMTMEGLFQLYYLHSVWPGDDTAQQDHPLTQGERINLTWRRITRHLDGSEECKQFKCPLSESSTNADGK
ncbi:unnamed protein product [Amoebophrya sp. A25]|nr:unnamed protein product [Amoebophrya sp. A25]|eukprot:GSA25T00018094001.1